MLPFVALLGAGRSAAQDEVVRPNVLMIVLDDLNDWIGCMGGHPQATTPNIDRLAEHGTLFLNAHCQSPICNPSRTSVFTGLRPTTTGVYALEPWFRESRRGRHSRAVTLPQAFARAGYQTLTVGKVYHGMYPPRNQRDAEFEHWGPSSETAPKPKEKLVPTPGINHPLVDWGTFDHLDRDKPDYQTASWAISRLEEKRGAPFFMTVGFSLPHFPLYATESWIERYPRDSVVLPTVGEDDRADVPDFAWYLNWRVAEPRLSWFRKNRQWRSLVQSYLACTSFVDAQVGRVLRALDASGLADETIVVLWSDHGWHLGEKSVVGKTTLWERSTRVPLIISGPGVTKGARCTRPAELLDLYPTLIELCGLEAVDGLEGHSLTPQLADATAPRDHPAITTHSPDNHAVRSERHRYIRYGDGSEELYDLERDPDELTNLAADPELDELKKQLAGWIPARAAAPLPGSHFRLLTEKGGTWYWENKPIDPAQMPGG